MSCYICLEEEGQLMNVRGCDCKGSIAIHRACLQEWMVKTDNPFKCTVCKGDYAGSFLKNFLTEEEILFHPKGEETEYEEESEPVVGIYNGIRIVEYDDVLLFETDRQRTVYFEMIDKEDFAVKTELRKRQKNAMKFQVKAQRRPKWSKSAPFRK
jgi:hypothetical protein